MNKEILLIGEAIANERDVPKEEVLGAVEQALATVTAKRYDEPVQIRVAIDPKTGDYESFRQWTVMPEADIEEPGMQINEAEAAKIDEDLKVGDVIEEPVESVAFGRIAAQHAKQVIIQKVREIERTKIIERYKKQVGDLVNGTVKRVTRDNIIVDLGNNAEVLMPREQIIPREIFRTNDRVKAIVLETREDKRGAHVLLSRTAPEFIAALFKLEVPEINEEVIEIMSAAREAGVRAKISVKTNDKRIDPKGACVGMRGARVQAVSNELNAERIDIILWDDNPVQFVINALEPAKVKAIMADEETHSMDVAVAEEQLSLAIGRSGQNVRLAAELTGWTLNVMSEEDAEIKQSQEADQAVQKFAEALTIDADLAGTLVASGFTSLEEIAYIDSAELLEVPGVDEALASELQQRASDYLLTQEIAADTDLDIFKDDNNLMEVPSMTAQVASALTEHGITTRDDLGDLATDELIELVPDLSEEDASKLIMECREFWFRDGDEDEEEQA